MQTNIEPATGALYRQVLQKLLARIDSGKIGVGDSLPPEPELAAQFSVSRHTMREALRILRELGVIDRKPGAGTVIKSRRPQPSYVQVLDSPAELLQYPPSRLTVLASGIVRADRRLARVLQCRTGERWFRVQAVRKLRGQRLPICWLDLHLAPEYSGVLPLIGKRDYPIYEMLRDKYGVHTHAVSVDLGVSVIAEHMAEALRTTAGAPALRVVRRYFAESRQAFQISVSEHPAGRYDYRLQLQYGLNAGRTTHDQSVR